MIEDGQGSGQPDRRWPMRASSTRPRSRPRAWPRSSRGSNEIRALERKADYAALAAQADRIGIGVPFAGFVGQDDKQPDHYIAGIVPGRPRHARPRLLFVDDAKMADMRANISSI